MIDFSANRFYADGTMNENAKSSDVEPTGNIFTSPLVYTISSARKLVLKSCRKSTESVSCCRSPHVFVETIYQNDFHQSCLLYISNAPLILSAISFIRFVLICTPPIFLWTHYCCMQCFIAITGIANHPKPGCRRYHQ